MKKRHAIVAFFLLVAIFSYFFGLSLVQFARYNPKEGDIIFATLPPGPYSDELTTLYGSGGIVSDCGVITATIPASAGSWKILDIIASFIHAEPWVVVHSDPQAENGSGGVVATPLYWYIYTHPRKNLSAYSFQPTFTRYIPQFVENVTAKIGSPWSPKSVDDDDAYSSAELLYSSFLQVYGQTLGEHSQLGNLPFQPLNIQIRERENGTIPHSRVIISPLDIMRAKELQASHYCNGDKSFEFWCK